MKSDLQLNFLILLISVVFSLCVVGNDQHRIKLINLENGHSFWISNYDLGDIASYNSITKKYVIYPPKKDSIEIHYRMYYAQVHGTLDGYLVNQELNNDNLMQ